MQHKFLIHDTKDNVGVAVSDIKAGEKVKGEILDIHKVVEVKAKDSIPLGHKIALSDLDVGASVIKYGLPIGKTIQIVAVGNHVHVHNLKSARW